MKTTLPMRRVEAAFPSVVSHWLPRRICTHSVQRYRQSTRPNTRQIHSSHPNEQHLAIPVPGQMLPHATQQPASSSLAALPLSQILRTYLITSVSSSPSLLHASTYMLQSMLDSKSVLTSIDRNPLVRAILWHTFYLQFCAGETPAQVRKTCSDLRSQGYSGVILEYALEVLKDAEGDEVQDVEIWRQGMLESVEAAAEEDFVGLKWSGMGAAAMKLMKDNAKPSRRMDEAMNMVCRAAARKNVSLLPAAEETWTLEGFFSWTMRQQRLYNQKGKSVVYNTYQAYLKQTPENLSKHLDTARQDDFALGIKLVRGAYLGSEVRSLIHPSIEVTHSAYDELAAALIHRKYNRFLNPSTSSSGIWPEINVVLATHNAVSVEKAQSLRREQSARGEALTKLCFAQLQGMADEVSCSLLAATRNNDMSIGAINERTFKCTTWGSMHQCLNYLLRRAAENKDAAGRTTDSRRAAQAELGRRLKATIGLT